MREGAVASPANPVLSGLSEAQPSSPLGQSPLGRRRLTAVAATRATGVGKRARRKKAEKIKRKGTKKWGGMTKKGGRGSSMVAHAQPSISGDRGRRVA